MKKIPMILAVALAVCTLIADDAVQNQETQEKITPSSNQDKLQSSLQETDLEIKLREKIVKQIQEQKETKEMQAQLESEQPSFLHKVLMYVPNRFIDLSEIISMGAGVGPQASIEMTFTKYGQFGGSYGDRYFIEKGYNRQYGGGYDTGHNLAFLCWSNEKKIVDYCFGYVKPYVNLPLKDSSVQSPSEEPYKSGNVDFWRIGFKAGWLVDFEFAFHPVAMANFFTGFVGVRLTETKDL